MRQTTVSLALVSVIAACSHSGPPPATAEHEVAPAPTVSEEEASPCADTRVQFASGSTEIDADGRDHLDTYAGCLARHETDTVYVAGMADPEGTPEANLILSRARAQAVADYLHSVGSDVEFVIRSFGETAVPDSEPLYPLARTVSVSSTESH